MAPLQEFTIRNFSGVATVVSGTDQERGTLRVAEGVVVLPIGALTFGPSWQTAWGRSTLGADILSALSGASTNKVHFCTLTRSGYTFLIAYNKGANRPVGMWQVAGTADPSLSAGSGSAISAPSSSPYRNQTDLIPWYGSWLDDQLWLGNGTDANLVWASGALGTLGPSGTPDAMDTSQFVFPPCRSWVEAPNGVRYGAGNLSDNTLTWRIWATELPNRDYPKPQGIRTQTLSYKEIQPPPGATAITALSIVGEQLMVHFDLGCPMLLTRTPSQGGWKFDQRPLTANACAINPNCTRDTKIAPFYLGSDLEIYAPVQRVAYNVSGWRNDDIVTNQSDGKWNAAATKPISGNDYGIIYDEKTGIVWSMMQMAIGARNGWFCYYQRNKTISGPFRQPDFQSFCQVRDSNLNGCLVAGIARDGSFLWADVANIGELPLGTYSDPIGAAYSPSLTPPSPNPGQGYVGVDSVNSAFVYVLNGQTIYLADAWSDWAASGSVVPDLYFNNARLSIIELAESNLADPDTQKQISALRSFWSRNARIYLGVYCEVNGYRYGKWRGTYYPYENILTGLNGQGGSVKIRILVVNFNDSNTANLQSATVEWLDGAMN